SPRPSRAASAHRRSALAAREGRGDAARPRGGVQGVRRAHSADRGEGARQDAEGASRPRLIAFLSTRRPPSAAVFIWRSWMANLIGTIGVALLLAAFLLNL